MLQQRKAPSGDEGVARDHGVDDGGQQVVRAAFVSVRKEVRCKVAWLSSDLGLAVRPRTEALGQQLIVTVKLLAIWIHFVPGSAW